MKIALEYLTKCKNTCVSKVIIDEKGRFSEGTIDQLASELARCENTFHLVRTRDDSLLVIHRPSKTIEYTGDSSEVERVARELRFSTFQLSTKRKRGVAMYAYTVLRVDNYHLNSLEFFKVPVFKHSKNFIKKQIGADSVPSYLKISKKTATRGSGKTYLDRTNQTSWTISDGAWVHR